VATFALNLITMKKATLGSMLLITLSMAACQKSATPVPVNSPDARLRKASTTQSAATTYSGRATGMNATVWNTQNLVVTSTQTIWAQTIALPSTGGVDDTSQLMGNVSGFITADSLYSSTNGQGSAIVSKSSVSRLRVTAGGHVISAAFLEATAQAYCGSVRSAGTTVSGLVVNGVTVTVTGSMNQAIYLPGGGMVILNEQSTSKKGSTSGASVTGMHIIIPNAADIRLAVVSADIKC